MPLRIFSLFSDTILKLFTVVLTFIILASLPMLFMILWPIYWLRIVTSITGKIFIKDFVGLLPTRNAALFEEKRNLVFISFLESSSHLNLDNFRTFFSSKVLQAKDESGKLKYPELQQKIQALCGFCYWKRDGGFDIQNHIKYFGQEDSKISVGVVGKEKLNEIRKSLIHTSFKGDQSPWEIFLLSNYSSEEIPKASVIIFKFSAGMLDLHSLVELLRSTGPNMKPAGENSSADEIPPQSKIKTGVKIIQAIYTLIYNRIKSPDYFYDRNEWHPSKSKIHKSFHIGNEISLSSKSIENISMTHRVDQMCVLFAGITGGLRQMMLKGNIQVPDQIRVAYTIPMTGKSPKWMKNHSTLGNIQLPVGKADPVARLIAIEESLKHVDRQGISLLADIYYKITGGLFHRLAIRFGMIKFATMAFSTLSFPKGDFTIFDCNVIAVQALPVVQNGDFGILGTIVNYKEYWQLSLMVHWSLFSTSSETEELNQLISEEFHILETYKVGSRHRRQSVFSLAGSLNNTRCVESLANI